MSRFFSIALALFGCVALIAAADAPKPGEEPFTWADFVSMVKAGGITMYPLGALSIGALAYTIERFLRLSKSTLAPSGLSNRARELWDRKDFDGIMKICKESKSALGKAILILVNYRGLPKNEVQASATDVANAELLPHVRACKPLIIIATVAPLLGLFGTILGMIGAFRKFRLLGESGDPSVFANNISEALVTAATGLIIAAWSLFMYHVFKNRALRLGDELEAEINTLSLEWYLGHGHGHAAGATGSTAAAEKKA